jgi:hypothetical protein
MSTRILKKPVPFPLPYTEIRKFSEVWGRRFFIDPGNI